MKTICLPADTEYVQFDELAHLIAIALHPFGDSATDGEMMTYGCARINLETELPHAVRDDSLPVKDPLTFGPHPYPIGQALKSALVSVEDLRSYLKDRCTIVVAADSEPIDTRPQAAPVVEAPASETSKERRARWLTWYGAGERGAVQRVYERELQQNPKADRSYIGKEIKKANAEQAEKNRGGVMYSQLVQNGKHPV